MQKRRRQQGSVSKLLTARVRKQQKIESVRHGADAAKDPGAPPTPEKAPLDVQLLVVNTCLDCGGSLRLPSASAAAGWSSPSAPLATPFPTSSGADPGEATRDDVSSAANGSTAGAPHAASSAFASFYRDAWNPVWEYAANESPLQRDEARALAGCADLSVGGGDVNWPQLLKNINTKARTNPPVPHKKRRVRARATITTVSATATGSREGANDGAGDSCDSATSVGREGAATLGGGLPLTSNVPPRENSAGLTFGETLRRHVTYGLTAAQWRRGVPHIVLGRDPSIPFPYCLSGGGECISRMQAKLILITSSEMHSYFNLLYPEVGREVRTRQTAERREQNAETHAATAFLPFYLLVNYGKNPVMVNDDTVGSFRSCPLRINDVISFLESAYDEDGGIFLPFSRRTPSPHFCSVECTGETDSESSEVLVSSQPRDDGDEATADSQALPAFTNKWSLSVNDMATDHEACVRRFVRHSLLAALSSAEDDDSCSYAVRLNSSVCTVLGGERHCDALPVPVYGTASASLEESTPNRSTGDLTLLTGQQRTPEGPLIGLLRPVSVHPSLAAFLRAFTSSEGTAAKGSMQGSTPVGEAAHRRAAWHRLLEELESHHDWPDLSGDAAASPLRCSVVISSALARSLVSARLRAGDGSPYPSRRRLLADEMTPDRTAPPNGTDAPLAPSKGPSAGMAHAAITENEDNTAPCNSPFRALMEKLSPSKEETRAAYRCVEAGDGVRLGFPSGFSPSKHASQLDSHLHDRGSHNVASLAPFYFAVLPARVPVFVVAPRARSPPSALTASGIHRRRPRRENYWVSEETSDEEQRDAAADALASSAAPDAPPPSRRVARVISSATGARPHSPTRGRRVVGEKRDVSGSLDQEIIGDLLGFPGSPRLFTNDVLHSDGAEEGGALEQFWIEEKKAH